MAGKKLWLSIGFWSLLLTGCVSPGYSRLDLNGLREAGRGLRVPVPHISQNDNYSCGTTSISMALSYYEGRCDHPLDKDESWRISGSSVSFVRTRGFRLADFDALVSHYGYRGRFVNGIGLDRLKILLSNGILVVLLIQPEKGRLETHAVLAVGYSDATGALLVEDPANAKRAYGYGELDDYWKAWIGDPMMRTARAGYVIYPKER